MNRRCFICSSDKFVDEHHYDCQGGKLSPETVPLCRRCHKTYHIWGVGAFSPDTTEKALEVENKRREILRSLTPDHPLYQRLQFSIREAQTPLKLEDVKRTRYWYKKWGIKPPRKERVRAEATTFKMPKDPPLCGQDWLREHMEDYTPEQIASLTIELSYNGRQLATASLTDKRRTVRNIVKTVQ